jgi:hypothetical protein
MMNLKKQFVLASFVLAFAFIATSAQTPTTRLGSKAAETELIDLDRRLQEAMVTGDAKLLGQYLGDDFVFTHGLFQGGQETKSDLLDKAKKESPRIYIYRKVSSQVAEMLARNKETEQMCYALNYVHLYERRKGVWRFISHRTAQMVEQILPCPKASA